MRIETTDLILRTVTKDDIDEVVRMYQHPNSISLLQAEKALNTMISNYKQNKADHIKHLCLAVCRKEKPTIIIGWCGLDGESEKDKVVIFYIIDKKYRNRGYATQAAKAILQYSFEQTQLESVYGSCDKNNIASYKIMRNIGMKNYGVDDNKNPQFRINRVNYKK